MTRSLQSIVSILLLFAVAAPSAAFGLEPTARKFSNCTMLRQIYRGGVAMPGAVNAGGAVSNTPKYSKALYKANKHLDRDKDRIACEN
jgi:hypothetical protein